MKKKILIAGSIAATLLALWYCGYAIYRIQLLNVSDTRNVVISLRSMSSTGSSYSVDIFGDGYVLYQYWDRPNIRTVHKAYNIPEEKVKELVGEFYRTHFFLLHNEYWYKGCFLFGEGLSGGGIIITSISVNGMRKEVLDHYGAPQKLKDLEAKIDEIAGLDIWAKGVE